MDCLGDHLVVSVGLFGFRTLPRVETTYVQHLVDLLLRAIIIIIIIKRPL